MSPDATFGRGLASIGSDILVTLHYKGNLPPLPNWKPKKEMVEEQSFVIGRIGYLSALYADRIEHNARGEEGISAESSFLKVLGTR